MTDTEIILVCAVRYALGRSTYLAAVIIDYTENEINRLSEQCRAAILCDLLKRKLSDYEEDCDGQHWLTLKEKIIESLSL